MASNYANIADLKSALSLTGTTYADPELTLALSAASRSIDQVCERRFWLDTDANQVRYYNPSSWYLVTIDDLAVLTSLLVDFDGDGVFEQTWTVNTDFLLRPFNAAADGEPYTSIIVNPRGTRFAFPPETPRSVKVTGQFGWPAVPDAVKEATLIIAARFLKRVREAPFGIATAGIDEGSAMRIARTDPDVAALLGPLIRFNAPSTL